MFGHDQPKQEDNNIPDASIQGALQDESPASQGSGNTQENWGHPGTPIGGSDQPQQNAPATPPSQPIGTGGLADLKQKALGELSPLLEHLDQSPEDKFRTTMMMIQATDDESLIPKAYEAAEAIPDEKAKAQALLDVINEINYFTQQH